MLRPSVTIVVPFHHVLCIGLGKLISVTLHPQIRFLLSQVLRDENHLASKSMVRE